MYTHRPDYEAGTGRKRVSIVEVIITNVTDGGVYVYMYKKMLSNTAILYTSFIIAVADSSPNNIPSSEWMWVKCEFEMMRYKQKYGQNLRYCTEVSLERLRKLQNISAVKLDCLQAQISPWPCIILRRDAKYKKTNLDLGNTLPIIYIYFKFQSLVMNLSTL